MAGTYRSSNLLFGYGDCSTSMHFKDQFKTPAKHPLSKPHPPLKYEIPERVTLLLRKIRRERETLQLILASISQRKNKPKSGPAELLTQEYVTRAGHFEPTETALFDSEAALLTAADRQPNRPAAHLILFDPRGESLPSERFAQPLGRIRDDGARRVVLAIGPA